jgi:signal peptidase II
VRRALLRLALVSGGVLLLDQWTKQLATVHLANRAPIDLVGELVRLTYTRNSGVAFGIGAGTGFPYYLFSIAAAVAILWLLLRGHVPDVPRQWALSLIFGGALGNLVDRLRSGEVVDFIEIGWRGWHWPVFNLADSAVTIGVVLFAIVATRRTPDEGEREEETALDAAAAEPGAGASDAEPRTEGADERDAHPSGPLAGRG